MAEWGGEGVFSVQQERCSLRGIGARAFTPLHHFDSREWLDLKRTRHIEAA